jgi:hypothetical protein
MAFLSILAGTAIFLGSQVCLHSNLHKISEPKSDHITPYGILPYPWGKGHIFQHLYNLFTHIHALVSVSPPPSHCEALDFVKIQGVSCSLLYP